jgi:HSP20 family protein
MSVLVPIKRNSTLVWPGFSELEHQLDRIFNVGAEAASRATGAWSPAVDIHETDEAYILVADLPGLSQKDIEVKVIEDRVTIRGTRNHDVAEPEKGYWQRERAEGAFERSFRLQGGIDGAKVDAHFENGVLTVKLPKPEETKPRQIEVKIS